MEGKQPRHLVSWNVNGLRAVVRKGAWQPFLSRFADADVVALQEIKATPEQLPPEARSPEGWYAFFHPARNRKGYSGVALYTKREPDEVRFDLGFADEEGRILGARFGRWWVFSIYFPNGGGAPERFAYKLDFYARVRDAVAALATQGFAVAVMGDFNVAHQPIDLARPKENEGSIGFHPKEREWFSSLLSAGFLDTFRFLHPTRAGAYSWWDLVTRARERNVGWRIDYIVLSEKERPLLAAATVEQDVLGSDHCPVTAVVREE